MEQYTSHSLEETLSIAREVGKSLPSSTVVAYLGGLGMGKTAFTAGLAQGMGIEDSVSSPTFALVNVYYGHPIDLVHFDMYRISSPDDLEATGFLIIWTPTPSWRWSGVKTSSRRCRRIPFLSIWRRAGNRTNGSSPSATAARS